RQIHVEPDGVARRRGGNAGRPYPHHLSQLLPALGSLGLLRAAFSRGSVMGDIAPSFAFHDLAPSQESFRDAVLAGLGRDPKTLPCKFFYDARGSALFEKICELPEYYLTRTEIAILDRFAAEIAADLKKDPAILNRAYNDKAGINAAFNLNLLTRINRELGGDFDLDRFAHVAFYSEAEGRVELYLKSLAEQTVVAAGQRFRFGA